MNQTEKGVINRKFHSENEGLNYLFIIGIDSYTNCPKLYNAVGDAKAFIELLTEKYQFNQKNTRTLFNAEATQKNIFNSLKNFISEITPKDNLLIYFSGHGEYEQEIDEGYWIPVDAELGNQGHYISNSRIIKYLRAINSRHTFLLVDSCFSGSLFTQRKLSLKNRLEDDPSRWLLSSGRKEVVSDGKPGDHSPFADNLLYFLRNNTEPSLPLTSVINYVVGVTTENSKQMPRGEPLNIESHKGGQFFFHLKKNEALDWTKANKINTIQAFQQYLKIYPNGKFSDKATWFIALKKSTIISFLDYRKMFPQGLYYQDAFLKIAKLEEEAIWGESQEKNTITSFLTYIDKYPNGKYKTLAISRLKEFSQRNDANQENQFDIGGVDEKKTEESLNVERKNNKLKLPTYTLILSCFLIIFLWFFYQNSSPLPASSDSMTESLLNENFFSRLKDDKGKKTRHKNKLNYKISFAEKDYVIFNHDGIDWMSQNLEYKTGTSWCYNDDDKNCQEFGNLYDWETAKQACRELGDKWRLPTDKEFRNLAVSHGKLWEENQLELSSKNYALIFAVNEYNEFPNLNNPIKDAENISLELRNNYGYQTEIVLNPTIDEISKKLEFYRKSFKNGTFDNEGQILIYFSGHGIMKNKNGYFLPKDANIDKLYSTGFSYNYWREFINEMDCKHILLAIDACYSGTIDPSWGYKGFQITLPGDEETEFQRRIQQHKKYKTRLFLASASDEITPDRSNFAYKFLEGLRSKGGNDGILTFFELVQFINVVTPKPRSGKFGDDEPGSNFLFLVNPIHENHLEEAFLSLIKGGNGDFNSVFGGIRSSKGKFFGKDTGAVYWTNSIYNEGNYWGYAFNKDEGKLARLGINKSTGLSCRCVKDNYKDSSNLNR